MRWDVSGSACSSCLTTFFPQAVSSHLSLPTSGSLDMHQGCSCLCVPLFSNPEAAVIIIIIAVVVVAVINLLNPFGFVPKACGRGLVFLLPCQEDRSRRSNSMPQADPAAVPCGQRHRPGVGAGLGRCRDVELLRQCHLVALGTHDTREPRRQSHCTLVPPSPP